jgi:asparagine synthase (glutamine-hydrolysing)
MVGAVRHFEYPLVSSSAVAIGQVAAAARRRGVKVLLTGEAADELFGGYVHRHGALIDPLLTPGDRARRAAQRIHTDRLRMAWPGVRGWLQERRQAPPPFPRWRGAVCLGREQLATARQAYTGSQACTVQARLLADLAQAPLPQLLNRMDKSLMAGSVEARVPFLDPEVVALALNLPPRARLGPLTKGILRDLGARLLGRGLARRPKYAGMGIGSRLIERWARPDFLAAGHLRELLGQPNARWGQVVTGARGQRTLWLWSAEIWARAVLDGQSDATVTAALWKDGLDG